MEQLNIITKLLAYSDSVGQTDNPRQRTFDWERRFNSLEIRNGKSDTLIVPPCGSITLFDGTRSHNMGAGTAINLKLISAVESRYRLSVSSGPSGFRTIRGGIGVTACEVSINNNAIAVFDFAAASLAGVMVGDNMRVKGPALYDQMPYAFGSANSGLWLVVSVAGTKVSCVRPAGESFIGASEHVANASADVEFYSCDGIQVGDKIEIKGTFSLVSQGTYTVIAVSPSSIDFISTLALPEEGPTAYVSDSVVVYLDAKRLVYIESNQNVVVRLDGDEGNHIKVEPIQPSSDGLVGFFHKWGSTYKCVIVNKSINPAKIKCITGE